MRMRIPYILQAGNSYRHRTHYYNFIGSRDVGYQNFEIKILSKIHRVR